jgi:serine/threonine-protein kinase
LIHRDIKPANVILCERGGVPGVCKVVDFGLVKSIGRDGDVSSSSTEVITGTPLYLSPEAILHPDRVDARSDLYALGALAYFTLTGTPVFADASIVAVCAHHLHTPPEPPSQRLGRALPSGLEQLILQLLDKDPARRPQAAAELAERCRALGVEAWNRDQIADWWSGVLRRREDDVPSHQGSSVPGTSETLAVDFRHRIPS